MPSTPFRHIGDQADEEVEPLAVGRSLIAAIGIDNYTHHLPLTNAVSDAEAVLRLFKRCGFEELPGAPSLFDEQATLGALISLVRDQLPDELQPDDSLVLFYAGHGTTKSRPVPDPQDASKMTTRRTGYLIPVDAREQKPGDWLRLDAFLEDIAMLPARHVLVILDACKSGFALSEKFKFRGDEQAEGTIAELSGRVSRRVITSAMHDQKAMDGGGSGNSLFTESLVDGVENLQADWDRDGYITTTDLFSFVRKRVSDTADRVHQVKQTPDYGQLPGDGSGELVLSLRGDTYNRLRAAETLEIADQIYDLGWLSGDAKRFESAARHYKAAHDLAILGKMPLPAARLGLGKALLAAGRAEEAAAELADVVKDKGDASPAEAQFYLGLARAKRGKYALAAEALRGWLERRPESVDAAWVGAYADWLAEAAHPEAGRKMALLVGINQYALNISPLAGCVNDATKLMQPALLAHGGFREEDMTVLTDSQATRGRFVQEMQKLQSATLADAVVVYYSGHSVTPSSVSERTRDYYNDLYLILHDTHEESGRLTDGITADDLHQLMQEIPAGRKTLILDTHANERLMELARDEGSYALILASDTAETAYERQTQVAGESVRCGMLTCALHQSLLDADDQTLSYGEWIGSAIRIVEKASSVPPYKRRQTPYFSGIKSQRVFGPDDLYLFTFEFSQREAWPALRLEELTKLYSVFCHAITVPHPHGHAAYGRAFLSKGAAGQAVAALHTAASHGGDAMPEILLSLVRAQFNAGEYAGALSTLQRYAPLAPPADQATVEELGTAFETLAAGRKHALLVGIDQYQSQEVPRLNGACNDVAAMKRLLTEHWGFQAGDIVELVDAGATREAILAAFKRLAEFARREPALFFFAGRGSLGDGGSPAIVPYDGRQGDLPDILLEELADLAGDDAANLVAVLDTMFWVREPGENHRVIPTGTLWSDKRFASLDEWLAYCKTLQIGAVTTLQNIKLV